MSRWVHWSGRSGRHCNRADFCGSSPFFVTPREVLTAHRFTQVLDTVSLSLSASPLPVSTISASSTLSECVSGCGFAMYCLETTHRFFLMDVRRRCLLASLLPMIPSLVTCPTCSYARILGLLSLVLPVSSCIVAVSLRFDFPGQKNVLLRIE